MRLNSAWFFLATAALLQAQTVPSPLSAHSASFRTAAASPNATPQVTTQDQVLARVMAGKGWETNVVLLNTGAAPLTFSQLFVAADGTPRPFAIRTSTDAAPFTAPGVQATLNPNSSLTFTLIDTGEPLQEAWSLISYDASQGKLGGYATIRHRALGGSFSFETTVPLNAMQDFSVHVPFDNTQGFRTQLTLVNPASNLAAQAVLTYTNPQGQLMLIDAVTLQPGQQMTIVLPDTYPDLANRTGTISVEASLNRFSVLGLRYNEAYGAIAAVPGIN
jgi:hypothetical protein